MIQQPDAATAATVGHFVTTNTVASVSATQRAINAAIWRQVIGTIAVAQKAADAAATSASDAVAECTGHGQVKKKLFLVLPRGQKS